MSALILALCCLAMVSNSAATQTPQPATPEAAAQALFTALSEGRWLDAARLVDPEALSRFREQKLIEMRSIREPKPMTIAEYRRQEPEMPEAVAEYMVKQANQAREKFGSYITHDFAGVSSVADLEKLSAEEMMARWFQARDPSYRIQQAAGTPGRELPPQAIALVEPRNERTVMSTAAGEHADIAHVVFRTVQWYGKERAPHSPLGVLVVRRTPAGWRVDPTESTGEGPFSSLFMVALGEAEDIRQTVKRVVTWPSEAAPEGRAFLTGYGEDPMKSPPKALVIEQLGNNRRPSQRMEVPAAAFEELAELLMRWGWIAQEP
ncbi:hypothetical protein BH24GEM2_BH24GEM2_18700 [soil metagenome]